MKKLLFFFSAVLLLGLVACSENEPNIPVQGIELNETTLSLYVGGVTQTLVVTISPSDATNPALEWTSSQPTIATVNNNGVVSPVAVGTATITVTAANGLTATAAVTVYPAPILVTEITLNTSEAIKTIGETITLEATVAPENATNPNVVWASTNENVATVDDYGKVTIVGDGSTIIRATSEENENISAFAEIRVIDGVRFAGELTIGEGEGAVTHVSNAIWATRNVDMPGTFAATYQDPGMFFQWGRNVAIPVTGLAEGETWNTIPAYPGPAENIIWNPLNDPCPAGWRLPTDSEARVLVAVEEREWDHELRGMWYGTYPHRIFLPVRQGSLSSAGAAQGIGQYQAGQDGAPGVMVAPFTGRYWTNAMVWRNPAMPDHLVTAGGAFQVGILGNGNYTSNVPASGWTQTAATSIRCVYAGN